MSNKAKQAVLYSSRGTWTRKPVTQVVKSKKGYDRTRDKKKAERNWKEAY